MLKSANKILREKTKEIKRLRDIEGTSINDEYMAGLYNGLELASAILEDRQPVYKTYEPEPELKQSSDEQIGRTLFSGKRTLGKEV